jgi:ribosomal protein L16/L10AE
MQESDAKKPRGRSAIEAAHGNVTSEDEARLDLMISDLYQVDSDEAAEIHLNYHVDRMLAAITRRCAEKGITTNTIADRLRYLDFSGAAYQVAKGRLSEAAAVDALFRSLRAIENQDRDDRYINFYG